MAKKLESEASTSKNESSTSHKKLKTESSSRRVYVIKKARPNLLEFSNNSRQAGRYNDVTVCVGKDRLPANRMVLASASNYFKTLFEENKEGKYPDHVEVEGVDKASMEAIIEFIYTESITISDENVLDLLSAANLLQIENVKDYCFEFLGNEITVDNFCRVFEIADAYTNGYLEGRVVHFMGENFEVVTCTQAYKHFSKNALTSCMSKLDKTFIEETSLYRALIEWTKYDEDNRAAEFPELFKSLLDVEKLPYDFLATTVFKESLVKRDPDLLQKIVKVKAEREKVPSDVTKPQHEDKETKILSLGGFHKPTDVIEVYNCADKCPADFYPDLPDGGRRSGFAVVLQDYLYYIGGFSFVNGEVKSALNSVLRLSQRFVEWEPIASMQTGRDCMGAAVFKGRLVVSGGRSDSRESLSSGESYLPSENSWEPIAPLQQARLRHALVTCGNRLYAVGGQINNVKRLSSVERLNADGDEWEYVASMQTARNRFAAICYNDCIYAIGGNGEEGALNTVEKYDPDKNEWSDIESMHFKRHGCSACVLRRSIYVVGGRNEHGNEVMDIECYDPLTGWITVQKIEKRLSRHSVVVVV